MNTRKLASMPYAQACVREYPETATIVLQSYSTDVVIIKDGIMTVTGLYSATTRKHISAFMREFHKSYQMARDAYNGDYSIDIFTGEVFPHE